MVNMMYLFFQPRAVMLHLVILER